MLAPGCVPLNLTGTEHGQLIALSEIGQFQI